MQLTNGQIKRLRAEGHRLKLKPVVIIGQKGLSENLHREIDAALDHHELLKLRIPALKLRIPALKLRIPALDKVARREIGAQICNRHQAVLVETIGGVIVIYRPHKESNRFAATIGN